MVIGALYLLAALMGIVGLVLGTGAAFLRDYVDDSLRGVDDVERTGVAARDDVRRAVPARIDEPVERLLVGGVRARRP